MRSVEAGASLLSKQRLRPDNYSARMVPGRKATPPGLRSGKCGFRDFQTVGLCAEISKEVSMPLLGLDPERWLRDAEPRHPNSLPLRKIEDTPAWCPGDAGVQ